MSNLSEILQNECINTTLFIFIAKVCSIKHTIAPLIYSCEVRKALSSKKADGEKCKTGSRLHRLPNQ